MANYRLSAEAKNDLIRIHQYGVINFGSAQADKYFELFFESFDIIAKRPFSFESVDYIKKDYRRCVCGVDSVYFKVNENIVEIMAIVGRQDLNEVTDSTQPQTASIRSAQETYSHDSSGITYH